MVDISEGRRKQTMTSAGFEMATGEYKLHERLVGMRCRGHCVLSAVHPSVDHKVGSMAKQWANDPVCATSVTCTIIA